MRKPTTSDGKKALRLQGVAEIYQPDDGVPLRRCVMARGGQEGASTIVVEWTEDGDPIEMKLTSPDGVLFTGAMTSKAWTEKTKVDMTLWTTAAGDRWLLDGVYQSSEGEQRWMITLAPDDE